VPEPTAEEIAAADKAKADADALKAKADAEAAEKAKEIKFSQADLDRIAGDSRAAGRTQAEKDLLEKLGVTDLDAAKAALEAAKAADNAKLSEAERLTKERDEAVKRAEEATASSTRILALTKLEGALRDSGINPERIPAALKLIGPDQLKVDGTDVTGIPEAIEQVKGDSPEWFGTKRPGSVDTSSGGGGGTADFRSASKDELADEAFKKYGVRL
jgi:hypothetical protein